MSFYMRYELSRLIREEEAKTFAGVRRDTGGAVYLHLIAEGAAGPPAGLLDLIRQAERAGAVLDTGDFAGTRYVVTEPIEPFYGLRVWLQEVVDRSSAKNPFRSATPPPERRPAPELPPLPSRSSAPNSPRQAPPPQPPPGSPAPSGPSEFTLLFGNKSQGSSLPTASQTGKGGRPQPPQDDFDAFFSGGGKGASSAPTAPPAGKAGEFTSLFGSGESPAKSVPPRAAPGAPPPSAASLPGMRSPSSPLPSWRPQAPETGIGEFDKVFNPPAPPPKSTPPPPAANAEPDWPEFASGPPSEKPDAEGNFTRFFGGAIPGEEIDIAAEQAKNAGVRDETAPFQAAGGFTRVFGPEPGARLPPPPPPPASSNTVNMRASQLFSLDAPFMQRDPETEEGAPEQKAIQNPVGAEPGEYTKMISLGGDAELGSSSGMPPAPQAPVRAAAPLSQAMPAIMTAEKRGKRIIRTVFIVVGALASLTVLFVIIFLIMKHFATPQ